jgi:hypothetical protein
MADGIRIRHKTLRPDPTVSAELVVAVQDASEPFDVPPPPFVPPACSLCGLDAPGHAAMVNGRYQWFKTRHITIDTDGYALVSQGVWEGLAHLTNHGGFDLQGHIDNPPTQTLTFNGDGFTRQVHHLMQRPILLTKPTPN